MDSCGLGLEMIKGHGHLHRTGLKNDLFFVDTLCATVLFFV